MKAQPHSTQNNANQNQIETPFFTCWVDASKVMEMKLPLHPCHWTFVGSVFGTTSAAGPGQCPPGLWVHWAPDRGLHY